MSSGAVRNASFFFIFVRICSPMDQVWEILKGFFPVRVKLSCRFRFWPRASFPRSSLSMQSKMFWSFFSARLNTDDTKVAGVHPSLLPHVFLKPAQNPPVNAPFQRVLPMGSLALTVLMFIFLLCSSSSKRVPMRQRCMRKSIIIGRGSRSQQQYQKEEMGMLNKMKPKRWFQLGFMGWLTLTGMPLGLISYVVWTVKDVHETQGIKFDEKLAIEVFEQDNARFGRQSKGGKKEKVKGQKTEKAKKVEYI